MVDDSKATGHLPAPGPKKPNHWQLHLQSGVFVVLLLTIAGLLAWLGNRYYVTTDWTAEGRNTLSPASVQTLKALREPLMVTVFARDDESLRRPIARLLDRYRQASGQLRVTWSNPDLEPQRARDEGVTRDGTLVLHYQGRKERLTQVDERSLTNAIVRLQRQGTRELLFLSGHGERSLLGQANFDLGTWGNALRERGFVPQQWQFTGKPLPLDVAGLVVSSPQTALLPGEAEALRNYLASGGNLLWLRDPSDRQKLEPLEQTLGVRLLPGTLVDPLGQLMAGNAAFILVTSADYQPHPALAGFTLSTVFPFAGGLATAGDGKDAPDAWHREPLITAAAQGWLETSPLPGDQGTGDGGEVSFDEGVDHPGPITLAMALERPRIASDSHVAPKTGSQRAVVVADGDFLANTYIGNGGNLELGLRLVEWLAGEDALVDVPPRMAPDRQLQFTRTQQLLVGFGFLLGLPALLAAIGVATWLRRRRR